MTVTSKDNQWVKEWRRLNDSAKYRRETGLFAIEGARLCGDAMRSGVTLQAVLYTASALAVYGSVVEPLLASADTVVEISPELSRHMSDTINPQGVFCIAKMLDNSLIIDKINIIGTYSALEDIQDPGNMGTIIRTANGAGYNEVYLTSDCVDPYSPKSVRASMSGVFFTRIYQADRESLLGALQDIPVIVADMGGQNVFTFTAPTRFALVIGNEANGVSASMRKRATHIVKIPMQATQESLNAGVSAGILAYVLKKDSFLE